MSEVRGYRVGRIVTCDPERSASSDPLGAMDDACVAFDGDILTFVGPQAEAPRDVSYETFPDMVITPGLVDAHTHACWAGSRHAEYAIRMSGGDYRAIQAAGGGILSTHRAVLAATEDDLSSALARRVRRMASLGVTTVEVKSGYGLNPEAELKQLAAIDRVNRTRGVPHLVPTFLALHAIPEDRRGDRRGYVERAAVLVEEVAARGLARFVDAYVDANAFQIHEARTVATVARACGLGLRFHIGQFADIGGAELAAEFAAKSADHLENLSDSGIEALVGSRTFAGLLPTASFTLGQAPPPISRLRAAGIPLVVASDANPGTAPGESLPLALALAVRAYGLTPAEAILGATRNAALSLGLADRGMLRAGLRADLTVWDLPHEFAIVQPWGVSKTRRVVSGGLTLHEGTQEPSAAGT